MSSPGKARATRIELAPSTMAPPAAKYAHGVYVVDARQLVFTSGVVPVRRDGSVPEQVDEQARLVWQNISAILDEASLSLSDIVSVTTYVVNSDDLSERLRLVMAERDSALGETRAASTLVTVPALAQPAWKMEIAVVAAR